MVRKYIYYTHRNTEKYRERYRATESLIATSMQVSSTYFASSASAMMPAASGAAALVPV